MAIPRCGDVVLHRPTGERWLVAYADKAADALAWAGWPEGLAKLSDCDLVERCSDEEHARDVRMWLESKGPDHRKGMVARLYGAGDGGQG